MRWAIWLALIEAILPSVVANAAGPLPSSAQFQPTILAQAGSTGGTIGKQDKSASGGEEKVRPRRTQKQVLRPSKPERHFKRTPGKSSTAPRTAVGGRWKFHSTCTLVNGDGVNGDGVITLVQTTASTFHGSFAIGHAVVGDMTVGIITDGKIRGKHISFLRHIKQISILRNLEEGSSVKVAGSMVKRIDADLVSMEPPTIKGYVSDPSFGACAVIMTKM